MTGRRRASGKPLATQRRIELSRREYFTTAPDARTPGRTLSVTCSYAMSVLASTDAATAAKAVTRMCAVILDEIYQMEAALLIAAKRRASTRRAIHDR